MRALRRLPQVLFERSLRLLGLARSAVTESRVEDQRGVAVSLVGLLELAGGLGKTFRLKQPFRVLFARRNLRSLPSCSRRQQSGTHGRQKIGARDDFLERSIERLGKKNRNAICNYAG